MVLRRGLVAAAVLAIAAAFHAQAAEPPDAARRAALQAACDSARLVRVTTLRSALLVRRARAEPDGLVLPAPGSPVALIVTPDARPKDRVLPWSDVTRIESERSRILVGGLAGLAVGVVVFGGLSAAGGPDLFERGDAAAFVMGLYGTAACTGAGLLIGAMSPKRTTLYP